MMTPFVGASIELMSPALISLPARPRAYAHLDVAYAVGPEYAIPAIGDPGLFRVSERINSITEEVILGQGGNLVASVRPLLVMAGAGVAFTVDAWDHALRIKPSIEYVREEVEISGVVRRAVGLQSSSPTLAGFRPVTLTVQETKIYHGIGPGLEVEFDTRRTGPFVLSLFLSAKAWSFIDNQKQTFEVSNQYGEGATFQFVKNDWAFAGSLGLRFRWVPE